MRASHVIIAEEEPRRAAETEHEGYVGWECLHRGG